MLMILDFVDFVTGAWKEELKLVTKKGMRHVGEGRDMVVASKIRKV